MADQAVSTELATRKPVMSAETRAKIAEARRKYPVGYGDGSRLYVIWRNMRRRCSLETAAHWDRYGGRGITVCEEWRNNYRPFMEWALANGYEPHLTIDRRDNDGNYEASNCRWVTQKVQANNTSTNIEHVTAFGETKSVGDWALDARNAVTISAFRRRIWAGWEVERALATPAARRSPDGATHCLNGHEYTPENTGSDRDGYRDCRRCRHEKDLRRRERQKAERRARGLKKTGPKPRILTPPVA